MNEITLDCDNTIHTSQESPIFEIPISEVPINYFKNQIFLKIVSLPVKAPKLYRLFQNKTKTIIEIFQDNFEEDIIIFSRNSP